MRFSTLFRSLSVFAVAASAASFAAGQAIAPAQETRVAAPRIDLSLGYEYVRSNAPPGGGPQFSLNGGYFSGAFHFTSWLAAEGLVTGGHANDISLLGQDLDLLTYTGGLKASYPGHRLVPFVDGTAGRAHGYNSYFSYANGSYTSTANSLAYTGGGGIDYNLSGRFAVRVIGDYLHTQFPNGTATYSQNHLMAGAGIVYKMGMIGPAMHHASRSRPSDDEQIQFSCTIDVRNVNQGDTLEIIGDVLTQPSRMDVNYAWSSDAGAIIGSGRRVLLDTANVAAGLYHVTGHASVAGHPNLVADCDVPFRIKSSDESLHSPTVAPNDKPDPAKDREFHANMQDALFDYDKADIRPDAQAAIKHDAEYLNAHPDVAVLIGGFADDRGSAEYNLVLGERRAEAARAALIAAGVDPERLQIISYGKEVQVCTAENEACRQQNRRAAFSLHP
jgi:outer membrane protein OmpA-like peptidoglycan-associated protein